MYCSFNFRALNLTFIWGSMNKQENISYTNMADNHLELISFIIIVVASQFSCSFAFHSNRMKDEIYEKKQKNIKQNLGQRGNKFH